MGFLKLTFVLLSFLPYRVGDDLRYTHYGFGAKLKQVQCKQNKYKEKIAVLHSIGIIVIKSKEKGGHLYLQKF